MTSHDPYDGRDPSRGKGIAHDHSTSAKKKDKGICSRNHSVIIDTPPLILSSAQSSHTTKSTPPSTPPSCQATKPQTTNTQNTTHVFMRTSGSCIETPLRPSHSTDPPSSPLHVNDYSTQRKDNDEFNREIAADKCPKNQNEVITYDHRGKKMIFPEGKGYVVFDMNFINS